MSLVRNYLGPDNAVDGLAGRVPDGAAGESLLSWLGVTLVTLELALHDDGDLAEVAGSPALHEGHLGGQTHAVHVVPGLSVVQSVQHDVELLEPISVVLASHDGAVQRLDLTLGGKPDRESLKYLY